MWDEAAAPGAPLERRLSAEAVAAIFAKISGAERATFIVFTPPTIRLNRRRGKLLKHLNSARENVVMSAPKGQMKGAAFGDLGTDRIFGLQTAQIVP